MHRLFVPSKSGFFQKGLLQTLSSFQAVAKPVESCNVDYSFQQRLYKIYKTIVTLEIRGFVMTVFGYMYLTAKHSEPYTAELKGAVAQLVLRSQDYLTTVQKEMTQASREIKFCGAEHLSNDQWGEFMGLFSFIVINELQVQPDKTCYYTCEDISAPKIYHSYEDYDYTPRIGCIGKIYNCGWIGTTTICDQSDDSPKRYLWLETDNGRYGLSEECPSERKKNLSYGYTYDFNRCDMCLCTCVQESATANVVRTFSLRPQVSDTKNNMVVVGVKFTTKDDMIHIQIQKGKLLPKGRIDEVTKEWVPLEDFIYLKNDSYGGFSTTNGKSLTRGKDFTFISSKQKVMNLDDILLPSQYIVTGVRLNHEKKYNYNSPVEIQVRATLFDYDSGTLDINNNSSQWFTTHNMPTSTPKYLRKKKEYEYPGDPNDPTRSRLNKPVSKANQFIKFIPSSGKKTAGMYTLPLFDLRKVTTTPSVPLGGVGIYLKHGEDYGGILALKIFNFDMSLFIDTVLAEEEAINYWKFIPPNARSNNEEEDVEAEEKERKVDKVVEEEEDEDEDKEHEEESQQRISTST